MHAQARLLSLPTYLLALLLVALAWLAARSSFSGAGLAVLLLLWLAASALLYAHLVVMQLYGMAERGYGISEHQEPQDREPRTESCSTEDRG